MATSEAKEIKKQETLVRVSIISYKTRLRVSANKRLRDILLRMFRYSISVYIFIFVKDSRWPIVKTYHFLSCSSFFTFLEITLENESCRAIR